MRRTIALCAVVVGALGFAPTAHATRAAPSPDLPLAPVDDDDDDANGIADDADAVITKEMTGDLVPLGTSAWQLRPGTTVRVIANGRPLPASRHDGRGVAVALQGTKPGRVPVVVDGAARVARFVRVQTETENGPLDGVRSGVELTREPPVAIEGDTLPAGSGAFREVLIADGADLPATVTIATLSSAGARVDALPEVKLHPVPCSPGAPSGVACASTPPLRLVLDDTDKNHPLFAGNALVGELGGAVVALAGERKLGSVRVRGPRVTDVGPVDRMRAALRIFLVRDRPGGGPPFGADDPTAVALARAQVRRSNALWGQCGISFGAPELVDVRVVDPPKVGLVAVGCDVGLPASGGGDLRVRLDGKEIKVPIAAGDSPREAARKLARALEGPGRDVRVSENARIGPGAGVTADVSVRHADGSLFALDAPERGKISSDPTLTACLGTVDLSDGLQHFADVDAVAGTLEERSLLRSFDDGDARTVEVIFVPSFATGGRIGESFIRGDHSSIANMLIEDRAGVRADRISFAMAHELGHVLLDLPGHTDDFGVDTPTLLMDSDAADPSPFGPRRITTDQCVRAVRQSGPSAAVPILAPWPLGKLQPEPVPKAGPVSAAPRPPRTSPTSR